MAGGFFSGGSSDAVNASVAEAEAAAREAEAARDEINNKFVEYAGQTEEGDYTVPNADDALTTKFLRQDGTWTVPPAGSDGATTLAELTDTDITNPVADQFLTYNGTEWINETVTPTELSAGTGLDITNNVVSVEDGGIGTNQLASNAVTSAKIVAGGVERTNIADNAINDSKLDATNTGTAGQLLSAVGAGNFTWITPAAGTVYTASDGITLTNEDFTLTDLGVTTAKLADDAVTSAKILNDNVTADELNVSGDGTSGQILSSDGDGSFSWIDEGAATSYTAGDGLDLAGTEFSIADDGVTTDKILDLNVTAAKIADTSITAGKIANATITATQLADSAVGADQLATNAVTTIKVTDLNITAAKLATNSVTNAKIMNGEVNEDKLDVSNTGTTGQLLSSDGDGTFTWVTESGGTQYTADGTTLDLSVGNQFSVADGGIGATQLASNSVTSAKIANNNVGADELNVSGDGSSGQFLASDGDGTFSWVAGSTTLRGLTDTNIPASITNRRFLEYSPSEDVWDAVPITDLLNLFELFDVALTTPTDNQFLRYETSSAKWVNETVNIPATLSGGTAITISSNTVSVTADGITNALLADNAVRTENIVDLMVTTGKLADDAVTTDKIVDNAVTSAKIAANTIVAADIANNTITAVQLATDSVSSFKLQDGSVISGKIANNVVGADELDVSGDGTSGQVLSSDGDGTFSWVANGSGGDAYTADEDTLTLSAGNQFSVASQGIDTAQIATNAITATQINDSAVDTSELANVAVTTAKIADSAVTNAKLGTGAVNTSKIFDGAITVDKLGTGSVTAVKIGTSAVTTDKINANAVTNAKLGNDIPISTLSDVDDSGVNNGQILSYNGTTWVPINNSGGNTDNSRLAIALTPNTLAEGDAAVTVTAALSIANMLTGETISGQSVTVTDPTGHSVNVDGSGNSFTFSASGDNAGNYVIRASATFTLTGGTSSVHSSSANLPVTATPPANANWYYSTALTTSPPTLVTQMTDAGVFSTGVTTSFTADGDGLHRFFIALPTRVGGYTFYGTPNLFGQYTETPEVSGLTTSGYTLYAIDDIDDNQSGSAPVYVEEM